ncbi:MAG: fasciclin domain-containing protein [Bauldia sp.]|nr:fasciclin domain-containing protein [Bauldia sp.]
MMKSASHFRAGAFALAALSALAIGAPAIAQMAGAVPMVGGAPMYPTKNIVENAVESADHTTLVAAVQAAGLVDTLAGPGPFTVFAPVNDAFAALPTGTVDTLLMPANKDQLTGVLTYHVIAGTVTAEDLATELQAANGRPVQIATVNGELLTFTWVDNAIHVKGEGGGDAMITIPNVAQSNGVIHVVDSVLLP